MHVHLGHDRPWYRCRAGRGLDGRLRSRPLRRRRHSLPVPGRGGSSGTITPPPIRSSASTGRSTRTSPASSRPWPAGWTAIWTRSRIIAGAEPKARRPEGPATIVGETDGGTHPHPARIPDPGGPRRARLAGRLAGRVLGEAGAAAAGPPSRVTAPPDAARAAGPALLRPPAPLHLRLLSLVRRPARLPALGLPRPPPSRSTSRRTTCRGSVPTTRARAAVLEQQARWIADSGVGAIALSWWGAGHYTDRPCTTSWT